MVRIRFSQPAWPIRPKTPDNTRKHQTITRRHQTIPDKHQTKICTPDENLNTRRTPGKKVLFLHQTKESFGLAPDEKVLLWHQTKKSFVFTPDKKVLFWHQTKKFCFFSRRNSNAICCLGNKTFRMIDDGRITDRLVFYASKNLTGS